MHDITLTSIELLLVVVRKTVDSFKQKACRKKKYLLYIYIFFYKCFLSTIGNITRYSPDVDMCKYVQ